jgi:RNA polymerase sigma-70 factor (ECF subfamily)
MIRCLPEEYQIPLMLTKYEGLTQKAVAERLGLSFSGAKSRIQRGRDQLRELMLRCCHFQFDRLGQIIDYQSRCSCCAKNSGNSECSTPF